MNLAPRLPKKTNKFLGYLKSIFAILALLLLFPCCGKKQKNIFVFNESPSQKKVKCCSLPAPTAISAMQENTGIKISWNPVGKKIKNPDNTPIDVLGYNIYKFSSKQPIPHSHLNDKPIKSHFFLDSTVDHLQYKLTPYYIIHGIFSVNGITVEGPGSQIIITSN